MSLHASFAEFTARAVTIRGSALRLVSRRLGHGFDPRRRRQAVVLTFRLQSAAGRLLAARHGVTRYISKRDNADGVALGSRPAPPRPAGGRRACPALPCPALPCPGRVQAQQLRPGSVL